MSEDVDTKFAPEQRERLLDEVRNYLPAFLAPSASEQPDPVGDVRELLNLTRADMDRLVGVHVGLSEPARRFVAALGQGLRRPAMSSVRPPETAKAIRGPVDWGATVARRSLAGGASTLFVVRPARRVFDTPENQALRWCIRRLDTVLRAVRVAEGEGGSGDDGWEGELADVRARLRAADRVRWLSEVAPARPNVATLKRLEASRARFYREHVRGVFDALTRWAEQPGPDDLVELLTERWFRPSKDWQLFELVVSLRLARQFADHAVAGRKARLLVGGAGGRQPFATYPLAGGDEIRLWYQTWPGDSGASAHRDTRVRHGMYSGDNRPDIVVQRTGAKADCVVLELKASESQSYLSSGLTQLLGYLKDRPKLLERQPSGWLVAPRSEAFHAAKQGDGPLWMMTSDAIAEAAVERFAPTTQADGF